MERNCFGPTGRGGLGQPLLLAGAAALAGAAGPATAGQAGRRRAGRGWWAAVAAGMVLALVVGLGVPGRDRAARGVAAERGLAGRDLSGYRVAGLSAGNPAQRFGVSFSPAGASVLDRGVKLSVGLSGFGYESALRELGSAAPRVSANRVSYRFGSLTEWYANGPLGLEQGFALAARPAAGSGPLLLSLRISGGWAARMDGGSVLLSGRGVSLSYGGLVVTDARGRVLRSALRLVKRGVLIEVDDRGAAYPLRIDPFIQQARLYSSNGAAEDAFGVSVAVSGNTVVVGAPNHSVGTSTQQGEA